MPTPLTSPLAPALASALPSPRRARPAPSLPGLGRAELVHDLAAEVEVLGLLLQEAQAVASSPPLRQARAQLRVLSGLLAEHPDTGVPVRLPDVAAAVVRNARRARVGTIELLSAGSRPVAGHPALLRRAVANLVRNACAAAPAGHVRVTVVSTSASAAVVVEDDGTGQEADAAGGLGLGVVRAVAALHGGCFEVGASPLGGWRVTLTLPPGGGG